METEAIIRSIVKQRADQLQIPLLHRTITPSTKLKDDFRIKRHEVLIRPAFVLTNRDPIVPVDLILKEIREFDRRLFEQRARQIVEVQSLILKWADYLGRAMSRKEYQEFIESLKGMSDAT